MVITLCGSTRFKNEMLQVAEILTLQGHIILMPNVFHHSDNKPLTNEQKIELDNLHKEKINMSDGIFVLNVNGYIGESTYGEIDWAKRNKKPIWFLENPQENTENQSEKTQELIKE